MELLAVMFALVPLIFMFCVIVLLHQIRDELQGVRRDMWTIASREPGTSGAP